MPKSMQNSNRIAPNGSSNTDAIGSNDDFQPLSRYTSETV